MSTPISRRLAAIALPARAAPAMTEPLFAPVVGGGVDCRVAARRAEWVLAAEVRVGVALPRGFASDDGALLSPVPTSDMSGARGALKPAHRLQPAATCCG